MGKPLSYVNDIVKVSYLIRQAKHAIVLTGAGISTESGLKDFRSLGGMWNNRDIYKLANPEGMKAYPKDFIDFYRWRIKEVFNHEPNVGHDIIAKWQSKNYIKSIITQNVDGYHKRASLVEEPTILELHGNITSVSCPDCYMDYDSEYWLHNTECDCGHMTRPNIVMFGEMLDKDTLDNSITAAEKADLIIVIGSSMVVSPANLLPRIVDNHGGKVVIINREPTSLDDMAVATFHDRDISDVLIDINRHIGNRN